MTSRVRRLTPWLVGAAACVLYLVTLSRHSTGDSLLYSLDIESGNPAQLLDPYHPLLHPAGLLFYRLWQLAGWTGRALLPLQVLNALAGGICAGLLASLALTLSGAAGLAAAAGAGFAVSGGPWMLGVEAEFVTVPLALSLAVLWAVLCVSPAAAGRRSYPVILGAGTAVAVAGYASSALLVPVVLVGLAADDRLQLATRRRHCLVYAASVLLLLAPATLAFLAAWSRGQWEQAPAYFFGRGYGSFAPFSIVHGVYAFLRSLALYPNLSLEGTTRDYLAYASAAGRFLFAGYYGLILLVVAAPIGLALRHRRNLWPEQRRPLLVLGAWTVLFAAFGFFWVPGDQSFWLPVLAAWWLMVSLALAAARVRGPGLAAVAAAVAVLAVGNLLFEIAPRHDLRRNAGHQVAQQVLAQTTPEDILLLRADDITALYLYYFGSERPIFFVSGEPQSLAEILAHSEVKQPAMGGHAPRLVIVDSDGRRAGWWGALLEASEGETPGRWRRAVPEWQPGSSLVIELTPAAESP